MGGDLSPGGAQGRGGEEEGGTSCPGDPLDHPERREPPRRGQRVCHHQTDRPYQPAAGQRQHQGQSQRAKGPARPRRVLDALGEGVAPGVEHPRCCARAVDLEHAPRGTNGEGQQQQLDPGQRPAGQPVGRYVGGAHALDPPSLGVSGDVVVEVGHRKGAVKGEAVKHVQRHGNERHDEEQRGKVGEGEPKRPIQHPGKHRAAPELRPVPLGAVNILLWHGYLLSGSGSNIYSANLARCWRAAGHDVLLLCQERAAAGLPFIDAHGDFDPANRSWQLEPTGADPAPGRCVLLRPDIGGLLPVYVYDRYEGFTVKRFVDLSDAELEAYTAANVDALVSAIERHRPDVLVTGHEVMGPYIARLARERTGMEYVAKLHGSALEYAVKRQERYRRYAELGLGAAKAVVGGSTYMIEAAAAIIPGWRACAAVVNPGCDVDLFAPAQRAAGASPVAGYVGKFIAQKGVHLLLAALGLTTAADLSAVIVGYGELDAELRALHAALAAGDRQGALRLAGEVPGWQDLARFLSGELPPGYFQRCAEVAVEFPGRLEHGPLARLLPGFDVLVVPSVLPEAFGMVVAEAAACGVLPVVPRHSGIGEAGAALEAAIERPGLLTYDPAEPVAAIASAIERVLAVPAPERIELGRRAAAAARELWAWPRVAQRLLALAR